MLQLLLVRLLYSKAISFSLPPDLVVILVSVLMCSIDLNRFRLSYGRIDYFILIHYINSRKHHMFLLMHNPKSLSSFTGSLEESW